MSYRPWPPLRLSKESTHPTLGIRFRQVFLGLPQIARQRCQRVRAPSLTGKFNNHRTSRLTDATEHRAHILTNIPTYGSSINVIKPRLKVRHKQLYRRFGCMPAYLATQPEAQVYVKVGAIINHQRGTHGSSASIIDFHGTYQP